MKKLSPMREMDRELDELYAIAALISFETVAAGREKAEGFARGIAGCPLAIPLEIDDEIPGELPKIERIGRLASAVRTFYSLPSPPEQLLEGLIKLYTGSLLSAVPFTNIPYRDAPKRVMASAFPLVPAGEHIGSILTLSATPLGDAQIEALTDYANVLDTHLKGALQVARLKGRIEELEGRIRTLEGGGFAEVGHSGLEMTFELTGPQRRMIDEEARAGLKRRVHRFTEQAWRNGYELRMFDQPFPIDAKQLMDYLEGTRMFSESLREFIFAGKSPFLINYRGEEKNINEIVREDKNGFGLFLKMLDATRHLHRLLPLGLAYHTAQEGIVTFADLARGLARNPDFGEVFPEQHILYRAAVLLNEEADAKKGNRYMQSAESQRAVKEAQVLGYAVDFRELEAALTLAKLIGEKGAAFPGATQTRTLMKAGTYATGVASIIFNAKDQRRQPALAPFPEYALYRTAWGYQKAHPDK